ncbi:MAG: hypothetical protein GF313_14980 [Caldithrix sp.]|nr:hypothetical protein [Caldithrix sp.]
MRTAHISDLHLCDRHMPENYEKTRRLLDNIAARDVDHLVITGDLTHDAQPRDLYLFRELLKEYGLLSAERTSIVIGNHDLFGGVYLAEDLIRFPQKCRLINFDHAVQKFAFAFRETFEDTLRPSDHRFFPFIKILNGLMIIGLNSIARYSLLTNAAASNGYISNRIIKYLKELFSDPRYRKLPKAVLTHHHFDSIKSKRPENNGLYHLIEHHTMRLYGRNRLLNQFKRHHVEVVLHGHVHNNRQYNLNGTHFLNGGGSVMDNKDGSTKLNIIDWSADQFSINTHSLPDPSVLNIDPLFQPHLISQYA